jgi:methylated-DNA-[protein]-cysteine S-methyltransferase
MSQKTDDRKLEMLEAALRIEMLDDPTWTRVRRELTERAVTAKLADVMFERHESPLGTLVLGATARGLVRVGLPNEGEDRVLEDLAARVSARVLRCSPEPVTNARRQLDEYFEGRRRAFDVALDWRLARGFHRAVLDATARIPYGSTASYREVAGAAGSPRALRATGTALASNPLPIVVPCHRVLPSSGGIGNYRGGVEAKARLLDLERTS